MARQRTGGPDVHLALAAALAARGWVRPTLTRTAWEGSAGGETPYYRIRTLPGEAVSYAPYRGRPGRIAAIAASELLAAPGDAETQRRTRSLHESLFRGKIVFIGATWRDSNDHHRTPFWWWARDAAPGASVLARDTRTLGGRTYGVEIAATACRAVLEAGRASGLATPFPAPLDAPWQALLLVLAGAALEAAGAAWRGWRWTFAALAAGAAVVAGSFALFAATGVIVPPAPYVTLLALAAFARMRLQAEREAERQEQLARTLSRYVSREISAAILDRPHLLRLPGRKVEVSVLFCDLRGFTALSETLEPAKVMELMNEFLEEMTGAVLANGGVVNKFLGDGLMAFWGAPLAAPDHADRACAAGRAMLERLAALNARRAGAAPLSIGVGVNSGPAVVGTVGYEERLEYTLVGDTVNLASRIQDLTKTYGVPLLVGEGTAAKLSTAIPRRRVDRVTVRGRQEPVWVFEPYTQEPG